jgi:predicted RNA-binding Zn ribbon-like protein
LPEKIPPFKLNAEHVALDFVNTLDDRFVPDGPRELLPRYADLLRFCRQAGILTQTDAARLKALPAAVQKPALHEAIELRELLARISYLWLDGKAPTAEDQHALKQWAARCMQHRELRWRNGRLNWEWKRFEDEAGMPALLLAQAAMELLTEDAPLRLHACASDTCRWLFLDTSKNRTRRWCDMRTCGNREKARRYSAAHGV